MCSSALTQKRRPSLKFIAIPNLQGLFVSFHLYCSHRHSHTNRGFVCVSLCVCVWLAQTWQLFVSVFMCVYVCYGAVKVYEPDGGCGQKQRIAKVHVAVTLCFLHDKDCQSLHPFALSLLYRPFLSHSSSFRLLFPPHPFSFPIQCLFSPTIAAGLFLC